MRIGSPVGIHTANVTITSSRNKGRAKAASSVNIYMSGDNSLTGRDKDFEDDIGST